MARITVEDCQERVSNRFLLVQMAIKRVKQYREGYLPLIESRNKEAVTALREIAQGKILPEDMSYYTPDPNEPVGFDEMGGEGFMLDGEGAESELISFDRDTAYPEQSLDTDTNYLARAEENF